MQLRAYWRFVERIVARNSKKIVVPGFKGNSLYDVTIFFWKSLSEGYLTTRAASLAFNFFLAFFPGIIFLFTLIPFVPIEGFQDELFAFFQDIFPPDTFDATKNTILDIINNKNTGLLSFGFILALYFTTNGLSSMLSAFNANMYIHEYRNFFMQRWVSFWLTLLMASIVIASIIAIIFTENSVTFLVEKRILPFDLADRFLQLKWIGVAFLMYLGVSFLYYFGPSKPAKLSLFSLGSMVATCLIILTSVGFSFYIDNFSQYNKLYGSIGTLIIILLWIYFNSIILLLGFELNTSIVQATRKNKTLQYEKKLPEHIP